MTKILSDEGRQLFELVNFVCMCSIAGIFGIAANGVNMIVFYKQGFQNTVNLGFFGLAISDTICLTTLLWASVCLNPLFTASVVTWNALEVTYLSAAWPHVCFSRITSYITVYITAERYLSIALPLKVKHIVTPQRVALVLCLIYVVNLATLVPEYGTSYLDWRFFPARNQTLIGILFTSSRHSVEGIVYVLHSILGMASFVLVIMFTTLLVTKLGESSTFRQQAATSYNKRSDISKRDKKAVQMVVLIASVLIVCYTPGAVIALATFIVGPDFDITGSYINISEAMWSIACCFQALNSSVNIFVYYSMSSKCRQTLNKICATCNK